MSVPTRVLVSGYYGCGNAGDEAILAGLVEGFRGSEPAVELTVLSGDPRATEREHCVRAVPRGLASAWRNARGRDLLISGGGGLLQDATSWRSPLYYLGVMKLAQAARVPVACLGHGIGPLRRRLVRSGARRVLSRAQLITVRDQRSADELRQLGVTQPVELTADLAFLLPRPSEAESEQAWQNAELPADGRRAVAVALREPTAGTAAGLPEALARAVGLACSQLGLRAVLLPMDRKHDPRFAARVAEALPAEAQARIVSAEMSARELLALVARCDLVIAMRLHALIFAAICGVPPVGISYDPKVDALMEQLGLQVAASTAQPDSPALSEAILRTWQARAHISAHLRGRVDELRQAASRSIELALGLLGNRG